MPSVVGPVTPTSPLDTYEVVDSAYVKGGLNTAFVNPGDWESLANLPAERRRPGMIASAELDPTQHVVLGADLSTWTPLGSMKFFDSLADLQVYAANTTITEGAKYAYIRGYYADRPGVGGGWWRLDTSSTLTVGNGVLQVGASGAGRYIVVFENGRIDVNKIGAKYATILSSGASDQIWTTETNAAFQAAWAMAQSSSWVEKEIWIPASNGVYQVSATLARTQDLTTLQIRGAGRCVSLPNGRIRGASCIRMMTSNTPILSVGYTGGSVQGIDLTFETSQTSSNTNGIGIINMTNQDVYKWTFREISFERCATAISFTAASSGTTTPNNTFDEIHVKGWTINGMRLQLSGTVNKLGNIYIQGNNPNGLSGVSFSSTITNFTKVGVNLTFTLNALPTYLAIGGIVDIGGGIQSEYDGTFFVTGISGTQITVQLSTDPGVPITSTTGSLTFTPGTQITGPGLYTGDNCECDFTALDIEVGTMSNASANAIAWENWGLSTCGYLHMEYFQSLTNNQPLIQNRGTLNIKTVCVVNMCQRVGITTPLVQNALSGTDQPATQIGLVSLRDVANVGGTFVLAQSLTTANPPIINDYLVRPSYRTNGSGNWGWGNAIQALYVKGGSGKAATAGTGPLQVVAGVLSAPVAWGTSLAQVMAQAREGLGMGSLVGSATGRYGAEAAYANIDEGTTVSVHRILRTCTDLVLEYSSLIQPAPYANPTEIGQNPFELIVSLVKVQSDYSTEIGEPVYLRFQHSNRYWTLISAAGNYYTEPCSMHFTAGDYIRVMTYCNICQSDGTTITTNGVAETGQLTALQTYWPRNGVYGGTLVTNTLCGVLSQNTGTINPATYNRTNGGVISITAPGGYAPSAIIGRPLDSGTGLNANPGITLIGDSILNGSIDRPRTDEAIGSGNGYFMRAVGTSRAVYRAATGGTEVRYLVGDYAYNLAHRGQMHDKSQIAFLGFNGGNDLFNGRSSAQLQADYTLLFAMLRSVGYRKIITSSITPRTSSTDGWQTLVNQTQVLAGYDTSALAVNTWLAAQVGGLTDGHCDFTSAVADTTGSTFRWKVSTLATNFTVNGVPAADVVPVSTALVANDSVNFSLLSLTVTRVISSNTTTAFTLDPGFSVVPVVAATVTRLRCMVDGSDNVHPTGAGHTDMAAVITANLGTLFVL